VVVAPWERSEAPGTKGGIQAARATQAAMPVEHGDDGRMVGGRSHTAEVVVPRRRMVLGPQPEPEAHGSSRMLSAEGLAVARRKRYEPQRPAAEVEAAKAPAAGRLRATVGEHADPGVVVSHTGLSPMGRRTERNSEYSGVLAGQPDEPPPARFGRAAGEFLVSTSDCTWKSPKTASARRKIDGAYVTAESSAAAACLAGRATDADGDVASAPPSTESERQRPLWQPKRRNLRPRSHTTRSPAKPGKRCLPARPCGAKLSRRGGRVRLWMPQHRAGSGGSYTRAP
jgi:hypothetical protein